MGERHVTGLRKKIAKEVNIPALALLVVVELLLDHANDNVVTDETTLVHDLLRFAAKGSLLSNLRSQHVTSGLENM